MKNYSNSPRKPMMAGGMAMSRLKRQEGTPAGQRGEREKVNPQGAMTRQRIAGATDAEMQAQRREELRRNNTDQELRSIASGSGRDAMMARQILQKEGKMERRTGPKEPTDADMMAYGGKAGMKKNKMMYGGKAKKK